MNSLSKVALLVTLFTVPFAGFAMEGGEEATGVVKTGVKFVEENPVLSAGVALGTAAVLYGASYVFGGKKTTETKTVNPQATEQKPRGYAKVTGKTPVQSEATTSVKTAAKPRGFAKAKANAKK